MIDKLQQAIDHRYSAALKIALVGMVPIVILASLVLDGGDTARKVCVLLLTYLVMLTLVLLRRPTNPNRWQLFVVKHGFLIMCLFLATAATVRSILRV